MKKTLTTATLLACAAIVGSVQAATITGEGFDFSIGGDWRTAATDKADAYDPDGDEIYGTDGYYVGGSPITAGSGGTAIATVYDSLPSYITSVTAVGNFYSANAYADADNPDAPLTDINLGLYYTGGDKFTITVAEDRQFILTVLLNGSNTGGLPVDITVYEDGGAATATLDTPASETAVPGYAFFTIDAQADDVIVVGFTGSNTQGLSGVAFEVVPEPGSLALLGLGGLLVASRRRRD
ncbi:MAG: PEP-CTERM sorting domain-containing protein [Phycisphaeraceae bacterium]